VQPTHSYALVIAGAGIIGACVAWHATQRGLRVAVIDAKGPAAAASGASDGAVSVASKRPGLMANLADASLCYAREMAQHNGILKGIFHPRPTFIFARSAPESAALDRLTRMLHDQSLSVTIHQDGAAQTSAISGLGKDITRVIELQGEAHMLGYQATHAYLRAAKCDLFWPRSLEAYEPGPEGVRVFTSAGEMNCAQLVIASGIGTMGLLPNVPMIARSGQLIVSDRGPASEPNLPGPLTSAAYLLDKTANGRGDAGLPVVIDPLRTGQVLIGSTREDHGTERQTDIATVRRLLHSAVGCLPRLAERRIIRVFAGVRSASLDGLPIVGALPEEPNVVCATGFEGDGICLSALIGREIAAHLATGQSSPDLAALTPGRFSSQEAIPA